MRKINKFQKPGKMEKLSEQVLSKFKKRFGQQTDKKKKTEKKGKKKKTKQDEGEKKKKGLFGLLFGKMDKRDRFHERRWKSTMDQKDESRLDDIRDNKKEPTSPSETRRAFVVTP
jgi:hypothetical protein